MPPSHSVNEVTGEGELRPCLVWLDSQAAECGREEGKVWIRRFWRWKNRDLWCINIIYVCGFWEIHEEDFKDLFVVNSTLSGVFERPYQDEILGLNWFQQCLKIPLLRKASVLPFTASLKRCLRSASKPREGTTRLMCTAMGIARFGNRLRRMLYVSPPSTPRLSLALPGFFLLFH